MTVGAADDVAIEHARQLDVVDIVALALDEARILLAPLRVADAAETIAAETIAAEPINYWSATSEAFPIDIVFFFHEKSAYLGIPLLEIGCLYLWPRRNEPVPWFLTLLFLITVVFCLGPT